MEPMSQIDILNAKDALVRECKRILKDEKPKTKETLDDIESFKRQLFGQPYPSDYTAIHYGRNRHK